MMDGLKQVSEALGALTCRIRAYIHDQDFLRTVRKDKEAFHNKETQEGGKPTMFNAILAADLRE